MWAALNDLTEPRCSPKTAGDLEPEIRRPNNRTTGPRDNTTTEQGAWSVVLWSRDPVFPLFGFRPTSGRRASAFGFPALRLLLLAALLCGCTTARPPLAATSRQFDFQKDTFAYPNDLVWEYGYDADGKWKGHQRQPKPSYTLHCFVVARSARQFFDNARFDPNLPVADAVAYRRLIHKVVSANPRKPLPEHSKIVIPGYPDLRAFSGAQAELLKAECGSAWQSYLQRGNWRMIFPFSRHQQENVAEQLLLHLKESGPTIVHLVRFPQLTLNHAVVIFDAKADGKNLEFTTYDPNQPAEPIPLTFDSASRTFLFPANSYFEGGRVDVYEIYHRWNY